MHAPSCRDLNRITRTGILRIAGQRCNGMSGQFDLRNYGDITTFCIFDNFFNIFLSVKSTMNRAVFVFAPGTNLGQFRIFLDFNAPSLVFGEMPVQTVHFVISQQIDIAFYKIFGHEMTTAVQQHPPPTESRFIDDVNSRDRPVNISFDFFSGFDFQWQKLANGLNTVEQSSRHAGF